MARPVVVERSLLGVTYLVLFALGVGGAVIEAFLIPQRVGGAVGLSLLLAVIGNLGLGLLGGLGTRTYAGAAIPLVGWFLVIGVLLSTGPGGDVILPGGLDNDPAIPRLSIALMIVGVLAGAAGVLVTSRYTGRVNQPTSPS